jgi:Zn-dependent protease
MKKVFTIATLFAVLHFFHDLILVALGRYTEINFIIILIGTIIFGILIGLVARLDSVKKWLSY